MTYHQTLAKLTPAQRDCLDPIRCVLYPNQKTDALIGSDWCKFWQEHRDAQVEGVMVRVLARGSGTHGEPLVFLSDGKIWDLPSFFNNYRPVPDRVVI